MVGSAARSTRNAIPDKTVILMAALTRTLKMVHAGPRRALLINRDPTFRSAQSTGYPWGNDAPSAERSTPRGPVCSTCIGGLEQCPSCYTGKQGCCQDSHLGNDEDRWIIEGEVRNEERHGEPDAPQPPCGIDVLPGDVTREGRELHLDGQPCKERYPGLLANGQACYDPQGYTVGQGFRDPRADADACVGQGKKRHDQERDPGMQFMFHTLKRRLDESTRLGQCRGGPSLMLVRQHACVRRTCFPEPFKNVPASLQKLATSDLRPGRDRHGDDDPRYRWMNPGLEKCRPEADAKERIDKGIVHSRTVHNNERTKNTGRNTQREERKVSSVEKSDNEHCADIVHDRKGRQEYLDGKAYAVSQERQDTQGKCNVRGHGDPQPCAPGRPAFNAI